MTSAKIIKRAAPRALSPKETLKNQAKNSASTFSELWKMKVYSNQVNPESEERQFGNSREALWWFYLSWVNVPPWLLKMTVLVPSMES